MTSRRPLTPIRQTNRSLKMKHHIAFIVRDLELPSQSIVGYFRSHGYSVRDGYERESWTFRRGSKWAALYRFDIRAYHTDLTVRVSPAEDGLRRVSCDFDVWTCMNIITSGDVATLEAEGRGLESVLRHAPR